MVRADSNLPRSFIQHVIYFNSIVGSHQDIHWYLQRLLWLKDLAYTLLGSKLASILNFFQWSVCYDVSDTKTLVPWQ